MDDDAPDRLPALLARVAELERERDRLVDLVAAAESDDELDEMRALARRYQARVDELTPRVAAARAHQVRLRELARMDRNRPLLELLRRLHDGASDLWERFRTRVEGGRGP